jgi:acylpyruvate hydrolase
MGPVVVTPDEVDVNNLDLELRLNGKVMQKGNTRNMIFDVPFIIEFVSHCFPLEPADIIATGTPAGVGVFRNPPVFLKSGDTIEAEINGIGILRNSVH